MYAVALLALCRSALADCDGWGYPLLTVSEDTLAFGEVAVGETGTGDIRVTNEGQLPLGIAETVGGTGDRSDRFPFTWSRSEVECPAGSESDGEAPDDLALVLGPGCSLPVHVTFTPTEAGEVWGSFHVASPDLADVTRPDGDPDEDWWVDPVHAERCVPLSGTGTGDADTGVPASGVPYMACGVVLSETACEGGDRVEASVFVHDPDGQDVQVEWAGDAGLRIEPLSGSATVQIMCPTIPADLDPMILSLYVVAEDEDGNSIWAFADLRIRSPGTLDGAWPPGECDDVTECGCRAAPAATPTGIALATLVLLLASRRRRVPRA